MKKIFLIITISLFFTDIIACTSAIFTGKVTKDGRPLMWKNRDTGELNNRMQYFNGIKYSFIGLVNSPSKGGEVWSGSNEVGFCIMNTASYNIDIPEDRKFEKDKEGELMYNALSVCKNLKDFENFLDTLKRPMPVEANFGVIDADGGAAYYEVNSRTWVKRDANDSDLAPKGYLVVTNFSFTGREDEGLGYIRHSTAEMLINKAFNQGIKFTPDWIMNNLSRSFYNSQLGTDVLNSGILKYTNGWFIDQDFISRNSTSAVSIFQGVKKGENPQNTIFWSAIGYGPLSILLPLFIKGENELPSIVVSKDNSPSNCLICDLSLKVKERIFPIKRGSGPKYFRLSELYNSKNDGYSQLLQIKEKEILKESEPLILKLREEKLSKGEIIDFYKKISIIAEQGYKSILNN